MDLLEIVIEDNNSIREELSSLRESLEEKNNEIKNLHKRSSALEKLNIAYSKDILLLSQAVAEQYEILSLILNKEFHIDPEDLFAFEFHKKEKKKKIVH